MSLPTTGTKLLPLRHTHRNGKRWSTFRFSRVTAGQPRGRSDPPGSILNIVEEINFDSAGRQRQLYGYGISAKRYAFYTHDGSQVKIIKASEHGLGLYYRPKEGRDQECDVPVWIKEGWQWILDHALGLPSQKPDWFDLPVMRRIAITKLNVMAALRR